MSTNEAPEADLQEALSASIVAIGHMIEAAARRITPDQVGQLRKALADGTGKAALFITTDGAKVEASVALIDAKTESVFEGHMLRLQGPVLAVAAPPGSVRTFNLGKMN